MQRLKSPAVLALVFLVAIWAYSWIIMKQVMQYSGPFEFAALRYFGGAIALFIYLYFSRKEPIRWPPFWPTLAVGLSQTAAFQGLAQWALVSGGAGKVSLFCYTMPFWMVLFAWFLLNEKPDTRQYFGLFFAAIGLTFVIAPWQGLSGIFSIALATCAGVTWAFGTVLSKKLFQNQPLSPINFTAWQMLFGSIALGLVALQVPSPAIQWTVPFIYGLLYSVFFASSLAWVLWLYIIRTLPTSVAGLSGLLVPITAILLAWLLLDEVPDYSEIFGILLVIAGLFIVRPKTVPAD